jgi:hypothetical protein
MSDVDREATIGMINLESPAGGETLTVMTRLGGATWLRDVALSAADELKVPLVTSPEAPGRPAGTVRLPADDEPFAAADVPTAVFSAVSWEQGGRRMTATADGMPIWHTPRDTVKSVDAVFPGRVRKQLKQMSILLETLLTSKLEKHT